MNNKEFAQVLRKLADVYETNEGVPILHSFSDLGTEFIFTHTLDELALAIKALGSRFGKLIKHSDDAGLWFTPDGLPSLRIYSAHRNVCELVEVGERFVPAREEVISPAQPERFEKIYEWKCPDSVLMAAQGRKEARE